MPAHRRRAAPLLAVAKRRRGTNSQERKTMIRVDGTGKSNSLIQVRGLDKSYPRAGEEIQVLQRLNLDVDKGDFVAFMRPIASGKTTLLNLLGALDVSAPRTLTVADDA